MMDTENSQQSAEDTPIPAPEQKADAEPEEVEAIFEPEQEPAEEAAVDAAQDEEPEPVQPADPEPAREPQEEPLQQIEEPKKKNNILLLIIIAVVAAAGFWAWHGQQAAKKASRQAVEMPPVVVAAQTVKRGDVPLTYEYTGQTKGFKEAEVRAQVSGILMKKEYTEGMPVKAGQVLFRIDSSQYSAALGRNVGALNQSKVQRDLAKTELDRVSALYAKNAVSKTEYDNAKAAYDAAVANVSAASAAVRQSQIDLNWTVVRAPISGLSSKEQHSVGNLINMNDMLTKIVQADPVCVDYAVPADEFRKVEEYKAKGIIKVYPKGLTVRVALGDGTMYDGTGRIDFQDQFVDAATSSIRARAVFDNPKNMLYPGQFVRVYVDGSYVSNVIGVPLRAITQTSKGPVVYVLDDKNVPSIREIKVVQRVNNLCLVSGGLEEGERIITDGVAKVLPGKAVNVAEAAAKSDDATSDGAQQN